MQGRPKNDGRYIEVRATSSSPGGLSIPTVFMKAREMRFWPWFRTASRISVAIQQGQPGPKLSLGRAECRDHRQLEDCVFAKSC